MSTLCFKHSLMNVVKGVAFHLACGHIYKKQGPYLLPWMSPLILAIFNLFPRILGAGAAIDATLTLKQKFICVNVEFVYLIMINSQVYCSCKKIETINYYNTTHMHIENSKFKNRKTSIVNNNFITSPTILTDLKCTHNLSAVHMSFL